MSTRRIAVVNPNTTSSMTDLIVEAARTVARPDTVIVGLTSPTGPVSIEGYLDEAMSLPGLLAAIQQADRLGVDGHVIACFDDTGLDAARQLARRPVVGIGEAAYHAAMLVAQRFGVVTTTQRSVPALVANIQRYGFSQRCAGVHATEIPVLALEESGNAAIERIEACARELIETRDAEAIVLGCAGMAALRAEIGRRLGCPVIDGVAAAVALVEMLDAMQLSTSRLGGYTSVPRKEITGPLAGILFD